MNGLNLMKGRRLGPNTSIFLHKKSSIRLLNTLRLNEYCVQVRDNTRAGYELLHANLQKYLHYILHLHSIFIYILQKTVRSI